MMLVTFLFLGAQSTLGTFEFDVVAKLNGNQEVAGDPKITAQHWGYVYRFSSEANRKAFLADPDRYEVQLGGACGRMSELSGLGRTDLFATVEGKLYIFASEGCRKTFLSAPNEFLENDVPTPRITSAAAQAGKVILDRLVNATGGKAAWRKLGNVKQEFFERPTFGDKTYDHRLTSYFGKDGSYYRLDDWGSSAYGHGVRSGVGFFDTSGKFERPMHPQQVRATERERNHSFITAMRAALGGAVVAGNGSDVTVYFDNSAVTLNASKDGKPIGMSYLGRDGSARVAPIKLSFTSFQTVAGVRLPNGWSATANGKPDQGLPRKGMKYEVAADVPFLSENAR